MNLVMVNDLRKKGEYLEAEILSRFSLPYDRFRFDRYSDHVISLTGRILGVEGTGRQFLVVQAEPYEVEFSVSTKFTGIEYEIELLFIKTFDLNHFHDLVCDLFDIWFIKRKSGEFVSKFVDDAIY